MKSLMPRLLIACAACVLAAGCGGAKQEDTTPVAWSSAKYHLTATHPANWTVKDLDTVDDPKTGAMAVVLFRKLDPTDREVTERPPMVKVIWRPRPAQSAQQPEAPLPGGVPAVTRGPLGVPTMDSGITAGWTEFGAVDIQQRQLTWPGNIPAEEATALAQPGTAFLAFYGTGQLVGAAQRVRVVALKLQNGTYEIIRIAPDGKADIIRQADQIVDSIRVTH
jgi:hypothetical protein